MQCQNDPEAVKARILRRVTVTNSGCWVVRDWRPGWYTYSYWDRQRWPTHRLAFRLWKGEIPPGAFICHTCDNPPCCNPDHLWVGDYVANCHDILAKGRHQSQSQTHCANGHEFTDETTRFDKRGRRQCLLCSRIRQRIASGWPEDLARTLPVRAQLPKGVKGQAKPLKGPKTHCKYGHPLSGPNLYMHPAGYRSCRKCTLEGGLRFRRKRTGVAAPWASGVTP